MKITDKILEDIMCPVCGGLAWSDDPRGKECCNFEKCKNEVKQKRYEVEENKLKIARECGYKYKDKQ